MKGTIQKRGKTYSYIFDVGKIDGKRKQYTKGGFRTKADAERGLRTALDDFDISGTIRPYSQNKMSVAEYLDYFMDNYVKLKLRTNSQHNYDVYINYHIKPDIGHYQVVKLTTSILQKYFTELYNKNEKSNYTIQKMYSALNCAFEYGVNDFKLLKENPLKGVHLKKEDIIINNDGVYQENGQDVHFLSEDEINIIIKRLLTRNKQFYIPFVISLLTGTRRGETLGLTWNDIDFNNKKMIINKQLARTKSGEPLKFIPPKTKSSIRTIDIPEKLIIILSEWKEQQKINKELYGKLYIDTNFICTRENGEVIDHDKILYLSRIINGQLNIKFKFHYLRHTHASMLICEGVNPKIVQERLGHAKIDITLNTYSHLLPTMQSNAVSLLNKKIANIGF